MTVSSPVPTPVPPGPDTLTAPDGTAFRDLDHDGAMARYEDPRRPVDERVADLLARMSLEDKAGLMFQTVLDVGEDGAPVETPHTMSALPSTTGAIAGMRITHFNVHRLPEPRLAARWANAVQRIAAGTALGIPVTLSSDPRHAFSENPLAMLAAGSLSQWPDTLGLAAVGDPDLVRRFADAARREYRATGLAAALHPAVDLATEPRWARQLGTFGADAALTADLLAAYLEGFQGPGGVLGPDAVACTTKHFPGGGPQRDGEDPHFAYGREQVYPGGRYEEHLAPFRRAVAAGTAAVMPYYGMPVGLELADGPVEEVGFGYNRRIVTGELRDRLGYDGVVVTDWGLVTDAELPGGTPFPARAWGVEHLSREERVLKVLDAGCDQFGGEECPELLVGLVRDGRLDEARLDVSVRRLLRVKFALGLFDAPYVDEDAAAATVGAPGLVAAGLRAQAESLVVLADRPDAPLLPWAPGRRVYAEGMAADQVARLGEQVADPRDADVAVLRTAAPYTPRTGGFLEEYFHAGSLEFAPDEVARVLAVADAVPTLLDVYLERPAVLTPFAGRAAALTGSFGVGDRAFVDALTGAVPPRGRLPFELPRSQAAVEASCSDVPDGTVAPLFPRGHGMVR